MLRLPIVWRVEHDTMRVVAKQDVLQGGAIVPDARIDVSVGWYDAIFCILKSERRVLVLLAPTERRGKDGRYVDVL